MLIMLVEDDEDYADMIAHVLRRESHEVVVTGSATAAVRFSEKKAPDLVVLDVMLPDGSGIDVCRQLRATRPDMPMLFLSSLDRTSDVVTGLSAGADDYVTKPFHPSELAARVRSLGRRADVSVDRALPQRLQIGSLDLDLANQAAYFNGRNLNLTRLEFDILGQLVRYPGQVLSHAFLTEHIWGYQNVDDATLLKGHMSSIRRKMREAGGDEESIRTVHGVGYCFTPV